MNVELLEGGVGSLADDTRRYRSPADSGPEDFGNRTVGERFQSRPHRSACELSEIQKGAGVTLEIFSVRDLTKVNFPPLCARNIVP